MPHTVRTSLDISVARWMAAGFVFLVIACFFYFFTYNSGYGSDACEYLMIGRALLNGVRISAFVLSKGWATYAMTAAALAVIPAANHAWISLVITLLFALAVGGTWWSGYRLFGPATGALSALLVAACTFFMELNFLQPEIPVYLTGLLAVVLLENRAAERGGPAAGRAFLAGIFLGIGFAFKAVALFYVAAIFAHLLFSERRYPVRERGRAALWISLGFAGALTVPAAYFAATGQLRHHILWSFVFPLFYYPANTFYLRKLYTKLLWFFLLLVGTLLLSATRPFRGAIFGNPRISLALWMGGLSLASLFKTQSSHYAFPAAAFLSFFIAQTLYHWWTRKPGRQALPIWVPAAAAFSMIVSAYLYNPATLTRYFHKRDFHSEDLLAARLQALVPADDRVLFLQGGKTLYWLTDRYPNVPIVHTDVQVSYLLFEQPDMLTRALDDPKLKLVTFDPENPQFDDPRFFASQHHRELIARFSERLQERFTRWKDPPEPGMTIWIR